MCNNIFVMVANHIFVCMSVCLFIYSFLSSYEPIIIIQQFAIITNNVDCFSHVM